MSRKHWITAEREENAARIAALEAEVKALRDGIAGLRGHLLSPKFHTDTTIQVGDVDHRLVEITMAAVDAHYAANES